MPELAGIEFVQTIGQGAMGAVYLARQTALNRYVAAKQILGAWNGDPEMLARFQREARALAQMNHPNVVGIYDLTTAGNDLFMIMEYVRGPSLREVMNRQQLTVSQALHALGDIAAALEYASRLGIIHRDLKPGNVFVTVAGSSKLGDFGLVKMLSGQANFQTQAGTILGTPAYMSPEQAEGMASIDQRTDVYSLSVMAYELLTGRLPFPSIPGNIMASLDAHISQPPPKPSEIVPGFPRHVEAVLLEGLAKDPKKRPGSGGELWQQLRAAANKDWSGWERDSDLATVALAAAPPAPPPLPAPGVVSTPAAANPAPATAGAPQPSAYPAPSEPPAMAPPPSRVVAPSPPPSAPVQPVAASALPDETMARATGAPDETMIRPASAPDETVVRPSSAPDETIVRPAPGPGLDETVAMPAAPPFAAPAAAVSASGTGQPPPVSGSAATPQVALPVYQPPPTKSRRRGGGAGRFLLILVLLLVLVAVGVAAYLFLSGSGPFGGGSPLTVSAVNTTVNPNTGKCASSTYLFTGHIHTNAAGGEITYQWVKPDGTTTDPQVASIKRGDSDAAATLQFTYQGNGNAEGDAVLRVLKPTNLSSQAVHITYTCP